MSAGLMEPSVEAAPGRRLARPRLRGLDPALTVAGATCALIVLLALLAPLIAPYNPDATNILQRSLGPSSQHLFGTDSLGRDIFSRVLYGAQVSLFGPFCVVVLAVGLGTSLAIASVWIGGQFDAIISRALDILFAFPGLLIAVIAVAVFGAGMVAPILALAVAYTPYIARVVKSVALRERNMAYIDTCSMMGYSGMRICVRHLLPNVRGMIVAQATIAFASAIVDLAAISFLGLGAQPPSSQWGLMVQDGGNELLNGQIEQVMAAGGAIVLTVIAFNVLGERLSARAATRSR
jgi:peptide/nickel transport system permease protein